MSKKRNAPPSLSGNDGTWYLDLLGVGGNSKSAAASLDNAAIGPGSRAQTTAEVVTELLDPTVVTQPLEDWEPDPLDRRLRTRRSFRWSVVAGAVLIGVALALAIWWIPRVAERRISDRIDDARHALVELRAILPETQLALAQATDPGLDIDEFSTAAAALAAMSSAASKLTEEGVTPPPDPPPLVGSSDLDTLASLQQRFGFMGVEGTAIASRLVTLVDYRLAASTLLVLPDLPVTADPAGLNGLSTSLALALQDGVTASAALPTDAMLADHTTLVAALLDRLGTWQVEYLDALRGGDVATATDLTEEIANLQASLESALVVALGQIRAEIDTGILELASQVDTTLERLPT